MPAPISNIIFAGSNASALFIKWTIPDQSACRYTYDLCYYPKANATCTNPNQNSLTKPEGVLLCNACAMQSAYEYVIMYEFLVKV